MQLADYLIKEFAATTNDKPEPKKEETIYGVIKENDDVLMVQFDGSDILTPCESLIEINNNDRVMVMIKDHKAIVTGNVTSPGANETAYLAERLSKEAIQNAGTAAEAAQEAKTSAGEAKTAANEAKTQAGEAATAAQEAKTQAGAATTAANEAKTQAGEAKSSATRANAAAGDALIRLSEVEDVFDVLTWISEHGTYEKTSDTTIVPNKNYYVKSGDVYTLVTEPDQAQISNYYELHISEALTNFVASHLSLTNDGLYVMKDSNSYKVKITNGNVQIIDSNGHIVATYGESITFDSSRPQYIGGEDAFIIFYDSDDDGIPDTIKLGGNKILFGANQKLSDVLTSLDISTRQTATGAEITVGDKTVNLSNGANGEDAVILRVDSSRGNVFKNNAVSTVLTVNIIKAGETITNSSRMRAVFGNSAYIQWYWKRIDDNEFHTIISTDPMISQDGFALTLSPDKVDTKVTFQCELIT